jgi:hypothetical protein
MSSYKCVDHATMQGLDMKNNEVGNESVGGLRRPGTVRGMHLWDLYGTYGNRK